MEWTQFIILVLAMVGMFFWSRTEARADCIHFNTETTALRREMVDIIRSMEQESKDFHGRLCAIEERRVKLKS